MKNIVRARNYRKPQPSKVQAQTPARTVRLAIQDLRGKPIAEFDLPQAFYEAMAANAAQTGITLGDWVIDAINQSLDAMPDNHAATNAICENESAIMASNALMLMLFDRIELDASGAEVNDSPGYIGGLVHLIDSVQCRLNAAHDGVRAISFPVREVAK